MREVRIFRQIIPATIGTAVILLAAACGGSSSGGNTATVNPAASGGGESSSSASDLQTHSGPDGKFMTDEHGRTLYIFSKDTSPTSTCSGDCAKEWPAYTEDGSQVLFKGHPVYFFADDKSPGDTNGQGLNDFGGLWTEVSPTGAAVQPMHPSSEPSASDSSGGGSSSEWG
jgi:predicted lipoprotein with Yx(FWY)xxD motif